MPFAGLEDAALVLDALAAGTSPDRTNVIVGALALNALRWATSSRDILDAAAGLNNIIATGGTLDLDEAGRHRARELAQAVRASCFDLQEQTMADDPIGDAHARIREAISELRAKNIEVPISLYRAAHALAHTAAAESFPAASRASHFS
jgi:hypothetical protein